MNERIQQLAEQAGLSEGVFTRHDGVPCDLKGYSMLPEQMQKFAELLVRECLQVINQPNGVGDDDVIRISRDVKKHFGVE